MSVTLTATFEVNMLCCGLLLFLGLIRSGAMVRLIELMGSVQAWIKGVFSKGRLFSGS